MNCNGGGRSCVVVNALESRICLAYALVDFGANLLTNDTHPTTGAVAVNGTQPRVYFKNSTGTKYSPVQTPGASILVRMNAAHTVTGSRKVNNVEQATAWFKSKSTYTPIDLGSTGATTGTEFAVAVNDTNVVIGQAAETPSSQVTRAFVATVKKGKGSMVDMNAITTNRGTTLLASARDVNNANQIAVIGYKPGDQVYTSYVATYAAGKAMLVTLPNLGTGGSTVSRMNQNGQVVGESPLTQGGNNQATVWTKNSKGKYVAKNLDGLMAGEFSTANGINNKGAVVGSGDFRKGTGNRVHGFLWTPTKNGVGVLTNLNTLLPANSGLTIQIGTGIDDAGNISCNAVDANGKTHALVLRKLPEPSIVVPATVKNPFAAGAKAIEADDVLA